MIYKFFILALCTYLSWAQSCTLPSECTSPTPSNKVTCTGITEMPTCFPDGTTEVMIVGNIDKLYDDTIPTSSRSQIVKFSLISNTLKTVDDQAFSGMTSLTELQLVSPKLDELAFSSSGSPGNLQVLNMAGSTDLDSLDGLSNMNQLKTINLTLCGFRKIYDSTFRGLINLEKLYLHYNPYLYVITKDAFNDLKKLQVLHLDYCDFDAIYPEFFEVPFESGSLKEANTQSNPIRCSKLCEMKTWMDENPSFNDFAQPGSCYYYGTLYIIKNLDENLAGCGLGGWAIFGICMACVVALSFVVVGISALLNKRKMKKSRQSANQTGTAMQDVEESHGTRYSEPAGYGAATYPTSEEAKAAEANKPPPNYTELEHHSVSSD